MLDDLSPSEALEILRKLDAENSLYSFVQQAWPSLEASPWTDGWHLQAICEHLQAVTYGQIKRLIINIPPRMTKPVCDTAYVYTRTKGIIPLNGVRVGDEVWTHMGRWKKVRGVHIQGNIRTLKITTNTGREVIAAPDHPFLTTEGWILAGDLQEGSVVAVSNLAREHIYGREMSLHEARLLGYLVGDGCCRGTANITCASDEETKDIIECIESVGFVANEQRYKLTKKENRWLRRISIRASGLQDNWRISNKCGRVREWLQENNLWNKNSYTKIVPNQIMQGTPEVIANFIGAYWSCDGYISYSGKKPTGETRPDLKIGCDSVNKPLLLQMQLLLNALGITCTVRKKTAKIKTKRQGDVYTSWTLTLNSQDACVQFARKIKLYHEKAERLKDIYNQRHDFDRVLLPEIVRSIEMAGENPCRCLTVEGDKSFIANGFAVHNTTLASVCWPIWTWVQEQNGNPCAGPQVKFLCASYGHTLSVDIASKSRRLLESPWFMKNWGDNFNLRSDQNTKANYENDKGGARLSTSVGGSLLGLGGQIILVDDPHNSEITESEAERRRAIEWWDGDLSTTRLNDPQTGAIVLIMQRLHEDDLTGHVLAGDKKGEWTHLCLPMRYDPMRHCSTELGFDDPRTEAGELLCPNRFGEDEVQRMENTMGPYLSSGRLQQMPVPRGGGIIKREWWKLWPPENYVVNENEPLRYPAMDYIIASCDTAFTTKQENDYSACVILGVFKMNGLPKIMLMDAWRGRYEFNDLIKKIINTCQKRKVDALLIESKASGLSVKQEVVRLCGEQDFSVYGINPGSQDKVARVHAIVPLFSSGCVYAPDKQWADDLINEVASFPKGKHDDQVDALSQGVAWLRKAGIALLAQEGDRMIYEHNVFRGQEANEELYPV